MKFFIIALIGLACIAPTEARTTQDIFNDLRAEVKKGDAKAVELQKKIDWFDAAFQKTWDRADAAEARAKKAEDENRTEFGKGVIVASVGFAIIYFGFLRKKTVYANSNQEAPSRPPNRPARPPTKNRKKAAAR